MRFFNRGKRSINITGLVQALNTCYITSDNEVYWIKPKSKTTIAVIRLKSIKGNKKNTIIGASYL